MGPPSATFARHHVPWVLSTLGSGKLATDFFMEKAPGSQQGFTWLSPSTPLLQRSTNLSARVWKGGKVCKTFGWQVSLSRAPWFESWEGIYWGAILWTSEGQFTKPQAHLPCQLWAAVCRGAGLVLLVKHWGALSGQFCFYLPAPIIYGNRSNPPNSHQ